MSTLTIGKSVHSVFADNAVSKASQSCSALSSVFRESGFTASNNVVAANSQNALESVSVFSPASCQFERNIVEMFHRVLDVSQTPVTRVAFKEAATQRNAKIVRHEFAPFVFVDDESELECEDEIFNFPLQPGRVVMAKVDRTPAPFRFVDEPASEDDNELSLLIVAPEELGHFTPRYGEPIMMKFAPPQKGEIVPLNIDEIDLEIFDL